eukprot:COSAG01_NODE_991_length_12286_cov_4.629605_3_plen_45_part_00
MPGVTMDSITIDIILSLFRVNRALFVLILSFTSFSVTPVISYFF